MGLPSTLVVEVRTCAHGKGLFATEDIAKGTVIREFDDLALSSRPGPGLRGRYALRISEHEYWDGFPLGSQDYWSNFIDHSDEPNAIFVIDKGRRRAWLKATKTIRKRQEIFLKYDAYFSANPRF